MDPTRRFLESIGLPPGDLHALPSSDKRFPDGAEYRIEIPSTEGPRCLEAVLEEAERLDVRVHRGSQGSGVFMQTDDELDELARLAAAAPVEVSLFARPNARVGHVRDGQIPRGRGRCAGRPRPGAGRLRARGRPARRRTRVSERPDRSTSRPT